jgi:hypothetical protein
MTEHAPIKKEEIDALVRTEAGTILDFCTGPLANLWRTPYQPTWLVGGSPESCSDHTMGTILIALSMHQLCIEREVEPFANVDGTRIVLHCLLGSCLALNNLMSIGLDNSPMMQDTLRDLVPATIRAITKPLAPGIAKGFNEAWMVQATNPQNPVCQLVNVADLTHTVLLSLSQSSAGNVSGHKLCMASLRQLAKLSDTIDNDLKHIAHGIVDLFCELIGLTPQELSNDGNT